MEVYVLEALWSHGGDTIESDVIDVFSNEEDAINAMRKAADNQVKCLKESLGYEAKKKQTASTNITIYTDDGAISDEFTIYKKEVK